MHSNCHQINLTPVLEDFLNKNPSPNYKGCSYCGNDIDFRNSRCILGKLYFVCNNECGTEITIELRHLLLRNLIK